MGCGIGAPDECAAIPGASLDRSKPDLLARAATDPAVGKAVDFLKDVMAARCRDDRWSPAALACIKASPDKDGFQACQREHLTEEQRNKLLHAVATAERPGKESAAAPALAKMGQFRDQICACADRACVDAVTNELTVWAATQASSGASSKMDAAETRLSARIGEDIAACTTRALSPAAPN